MQDGPKIILQSPNRATAEHPRSALRPAFARAGLNLLHLLCSMLVPGQIRAESCITSAVAVVVEVVQ